MKTIRIALLLLLTTGCMRFIISEPLPDLLSKEIGILELPQAVQMAAHTMQPDGQISAAKAITFKEKITSYVVTIQHESELANYEISPDGKYCAAIKEDK